MADQNPSGRPDETGGTMQSSALRIALVYLVVGGVWVYFSTVVLQNLHLRSEVFQALWKLKGVGFVVVTALLLYWAMSRMVRNRDRFAADLSKSEERFRAVFERHPYPMWVFHTGTYRFLAVNDAAIRHYGYSREEFLSMDIMQIRRPEEAARLRETLASAHVDEARRSPWKHLTKDGRPIDVEVSTHTIPWADNQPVRVATVIDVTDRVRSQTALQESEERYRLIVETAEEGIWLVDKNWKTTFANARLGRILGYPVEEILGRHIFDFMDEAGKLEAQRNMARREQGIAEAHDFRFRRQDDSDVWVLMSTNSIAAPDGSFVGALAMVTDITHRKAVERLREQEARVLELIASGSDLTRTLEALTRLIQAGDPETMGSVLLLEDGKRVRTAAAPDLPAEYSRAIDGMAIGPGQGSCGTAMFLKQRVIVTDIATDPLWVPFREVAALHGLGACWSEPILDSHGQVLGSLAMYQRRSRAPSEEQLAAIASWAHLAGIAIERWRDERALRESESTNRALLDALPDMLFRVDRQLRFVDYHVPDANLMTIPPAELMGKRLRDVLPRDRSEIPELHLRKLFESGQPQAFETSVLHPERGPMTWDIRMVLSKTGEAVMMSRDITAQRVAQTALRDSQRRLELLVRHTPLAVIFWDEQFRVTSWNPAAAAIFGWSADEAIGRNWEFVVPDSDRSYVARVTSDLLANRGGLRGTNRNVAKDGRILSCEWYNTPLIDEHGRVIGVASVAEDVTERMQAQRRQEMMLRELDHRVKNNLASIASLAEQTSRATTDPREFVESFTGRLRAMARLHNLLSRSHGQGVDIRVLVRQTIDTFCGGHSDRATSTGDSLNLDARTGQALALALNELCTNATKYGSLSVPDGRVDVRWNIHSDGDAQPHRSLEVIWTESGGPPVAEPKRRGFGSELIEGLVTHELGGTAQTRYLPTGVVCVLTMPLEPPLESGKL